MHINEEIVSIASRTKLIIKISPQSIIPQRKPISAFHTVPGRNVIVYY